jgi:predicted phosphodiesterase
VTAVRGNNDHGPWAAALKDAESLEIADAIIYVVHDVAQLDVDPVAAGFRAVVSGHSHRPAVRDRNGVLYVNPGSAGPRRFSLPVSVGTLVVAGASVRARLVTLNV